MSDHKTPTSSAKMSAIIFGSGQGKGGGGGDGERTFEQLIHVLNSVYLGVLDKENTNQSLIEQYPHYTDFFNNFKKFCQYSSLCTEQLKENQLTNNLPKLDYDDTEPKEYSKDETVKKLVSKFIQTCTDVIRDVLEAAQKKPKPNLSIDGPLEEISYWREVSSKYGAVWEQVKDPRVQYLREVLEYEEFTSTLEIFDSQFQELTKNCLQARDNVKFLETLERYFKSINRCSSESLLPIVDIIPSLMRALRMVWIISRFYNTEKQMRPLMKLIDNDIVKKVKQYVNIQELVYKIYDDPKIAIQKLHDGISLLQKWKDSYFNVRMEDNFSSSSTSTSTSPLMSSTGGTASVRWEFNTEKLFRDSDHLKKLLVELRKVSEGILQCKLNSMFLNPEIFSGSIGTVEGIEQLLEEIQSLVHPFQSIIKMNAGRPVHPDVLPAWEGAFQDFRRNCSKAEHKIENFISQTFEKLSSSQRAFKLLQEVNEQKRSIGAGFLPSSSSSSSSHFSSSKPSISPSSSSSRKRRIIRTSLSRDQISASSSRRSTSSSSRSRHQEHDIMRGKRAQILERFGRELDDIEQIFHREKLNPPKPKNMPETVSRIFWSNSLFEKIRETILSMKPKDYDLHQKQEQSSSSSSDQQKQQQQKQEDYRRRKKSKIDSRTTDEMIKEAIESIFAESEIGKKVKSRCIRITKMIKEYEKEIFCNWSDRVEREARECLKKNILCGEYKKLRDLRVNFDTKLTLMVQETKYLDRILGDKVMSDSGEYGRKIPDIAMNITLQSDKFHQYVEELQRVIVKIGSTLSLLGKHERIVLGPKLRDLVDTLRPGFTMLNWNSLGINAFIKNCNLEINSFQGIVKKLQKNVTVLNNLIHQIRSTNLFIDPKELEGRQIDLNTLYQIIDDHKCEKMKYVKKKYKVLCQTLMKIESELLSTNIMDRDNYKLGLSNQKQNQRTSPNRRRRKSSGKKDHQKKKKKKKKGQKQKKSQQQQHNNKTSSSSSSSKRESSSHIQSNGRCSLLKDYYYFIERKLFRALMRMHLNTLKVFHKFRKTEGIIRVEFSLVQNEICETPERDEIDNMMEKIMNNFLNGTKEVSRFMDGTCIPITPENVLLQHVSESNKELTEEEKKSIIMEKYSYYRDIVSLKGYTLSKAFFAVNQGVTRTLNRIERMKDFYERFSQYWKIPRETAIHKFLDQNPTIEDFEERFEDFMNLIQDISRYTKRIVPINFITIHLDSLLLSIQDEGRKWIDGYGEALYKRSLPKLVQLEKEVENRSEVLHMEIDSIEDIREVIAMIDEIRGRNSDFEREFHELESIFDCLLYFKVQDVTEMDKERIRELSHKWTTVKENSKEISSKITPHKEKFRKKTIEDVKLMKKRIQRLRDVFSTGPMINLDTGKMSECMFELDELRFIETLKTREKMFDIPVTDYPELSDLSVVMGTIQRIYNLHSEFEGHLKKWSETPFISIQPQMMLKETKKFLKRLRDDFTRSQSDFKIHTIVKQTITDFSRSIPLFISLKSDDLRDRHWNMLMEKTGVKIDIQSQSFTLQKLIDMKVYQYQHQLEEIFSDAKKEVNIESLIQEVEEGWRNRRFTMIDHIREGKNRGKILTGRSEIKEILEEDMTSISGVAGTRHSLPFLHDISKWEKVLSTIEETVDLWIETQRSWMNLEVIFIGSVDIRQQLPIQAKEFDKIETEWQKLMSEVSKVRNIKETTNVKGRFEVLKNLHQRLQKCQKGLSNYLQSKRDSFPRFFYLSDDELLSILGSSDPLNVQKQITKMFGNVGHLIFRPESNNSEVIGMCSNENERFMFQENTSTENVVEKWLKDVQKEMKDSLQKEAKKAVYEYPRADRNTWITKHYGQIGLVGSQIWWTWEVEHSFQEVNEGSKMAVKNLSTRLTSQINELVKVIRTKISKQLRKKINTMIIIDVHARDIVDTLVRDSILTKSDFEWESQLRFYWDREKDTIFIGQCNGEFEYGFEYQGLNGRLVITPLTDRCFMTMTQALTFNLGGSPAGPAGTGKTESVKDLAKGMGTMCVVFNCSEGLDYKAMYRIFSGLCQNGAWGCFDEFNRIELPVLSVVSTQIRTIQAALKRNESTFRFDDQDIPIDAKTGIFITMNPGYAGRVELPDNLKALFRPVVMVVPDLEIICEIMLFSEGFEDARRLSRKMNKLYKLAKGQLSKQHHYDWGLRALKSILTKAGELKREKPLEKENNLLMKALYEMNVAKFVYEDLPLFEDLLKDLFVDISIDRSSNPSFINAIRTSLQSKGLKLMENDYQIFKVVQLYETMKSRHSTMVVGGTTGGKSVVINALVDAQTKLNYPTKLYMINPKAQSPNDLYGVLDNDTREWTDGVLSYIFRMINTPTENKTERRYLLFDGDVDTEWIESMNSVMDDNKLLTLPNGERISLIDQCKLLFEVKDLKYASPATVSRCGMVYVDPKNLDIGPYIWTWLHSSFIYKNKNISSSNQKSLDDNKSQQEQHNNNIQEEKEEEGGVKEEEEIKVKKDMKMIKMFSRFFERYVFSSIVFLLEGFLDEKTGKLSKPFEMVLPMTDINLVSQLCNVLDTFLPEIKKKKIRDENVLESLFIFCCIWSLGAAVTSEDRKRFDQFLKSLSPKSLQKVMKKEIQEKESKKEESKESEETEETEGEEEKTKQKKTTIFYVPFDNLPEEETLYEYYFDLSCSEWRPWSGLVKPYKPPSDGKFSSIIVPTIDTVRYRFFLERLQKIQQPVLFVGIPGTSKTVIIHNYLHDLLSSGVTPETKLEYYFSGRTTSRDVQRALEDQIEKKVGDTFAPKSNKHMTMFIDELNMPRIDIYGTQQPIAFLRFLVEQNGMYELAKKDQAKINWLNLVNIDFIGAFCPPSCGRNPVDPRFISLFNVFNLTFPSDDSLRKIFDSILSHKMIPFDEKLRKIVPKIGKITLKFYQNILEKLPATPSKFHYLFNLRDLTRVYEGLNQMTTDKFENDTDVIRLWRNECMRVFHDRLISQEDKIYVCTQIEELMDQEFGNLKSSVMRNPLLFGDFNVDFRSRDVIRLYNDMDEYDSIRSIVDEKLEEYNESLLSVSEQMNLVLFDDALEHLTRIHRILRLEGGHGLLIGVGGSGKQSLVKLATCLAGFKIFTLSLCRGYSEEHLRTDLRELFGQHLCKKKPVVFLFTDAHIMDECFLEYISNLLTNGTIPALFEPEEKDQLINENPKFTSIVKKMGKVPTKDLIWEIIMNHCRDNLHIILSFSPSNQLKLRCRNFPGLINNTTIDWFDKWPEEALSSVAKKFLTDHEVNVLMEDEQNRLLDPLVDHIIVVHLSVVEKSKHFLEKLNRFNYVTPRNYLDYISTFRSLLLEQRKIVDDHASRLSNGIKILDSASKDVGILQNELEETTKIVMTKQVQVKSLLKEIKENTVKVNKQKGDVMKKEKDLMLKNEKIKKTKSRVEELLLKAEPLLKDAEIAVKQLDRKNITVVKSFKTPHQWIMEVGKCMVILLQDSLSQEPTWKDAQREFGDAGLINRLLSFDRSRVTKTKVKKIREIFKKCGKEFNVDGLKDKSVAAAGILAWIAAVTNYYDALTQVKPLRIQLERTMKELEKCKSELEATKRQLGSLERLLKRLQKDLEENQLEENRLKEKANLMKQKLEAAQKLINGLSSEKLRWGKEVEQLKEHRIKLLGDCIISASFLSYLGSFTHEYRSQLFEKWEEDLKRRNIPRNFGKKVDDILSNEVETAQWEAEGLPNDEVSVQNGVFTERGRKFPICIDPQLQALKWIKKKESKNDLQVRTMSSIDKSLENAMKFGKPFLFENVGENIDPIIEPILNMMMNTSSNGGDSSSEKVKRKVKFGEEEIEVDNDFRLYLCSRMSNPKYSPDIQGSALVINYSVTFDGLIEQLLSSVVKNEIPQLEKQRKELITNNSQNKSKLAQLEEKILKELNLAASSDQSLIENQDLIKVLDDTKNKVEEINEKIKISKETTNKIDKIREQYRVVAIRGAVLFFVMSSLSKINSMYEYSLESYLNDVFVQSLKRSEMSNSLTGRLTNIINYLTNLMYDYVCTGLFEKDKLTFSMLMTIEILRNSKQMNSKELDFFLKGNISLEKLETKNPFSWVSEKGWKDLNLLIKLNEKFENVINDIKQNEREWKKWYNHETPENINFPSGYSDNKLNEFQELCLLRCLRVDRILKSVTKFITLTMKSNKFVRPPILNYRKIFKQSSNVSPIICMIAPGYDPANDILKLAERISQRCYHISLGQGMEGKAREMIERGMAKGQWVLLQNCHLLIQWMKEVEKMINSMDKDLVHSKFRLWMTSEVTGDFPISILQKSLKVVTEPPNSLKLNMVSSYSNLTNDQLNECPHQSFKQLIFVLTYFHAIIQERKKYGKTGWNVPYDFNNSDYLVSFSLLRTYLKKAFESSGPVPWSSLKYLVGEAMYGGRVTDDFDRRILVTYLNEYMGEFLFDTFQPFHFFQNENIDYKLPQININLSSGIDLSVSKINKKRKKMKKNEEEEEKEEEETEGEEIDNNESKKKKKKITTTTTPLTMMMNEKEEKWNLKKYVEFIEKNIKLENPPEIVGLHSNAEIGYLTSCSKDLWNNLILVQSSNNNTETEEDDENENENEESEAIESTTTTTITKEEKSLKMISDLEKLIPSTYLIDREALKKRIGKHINPIQVVLLQEVERWNLLVETILESLFNLKRALIGDIPMSKELECVHQHLKNGQLPSLWRKYCPKTQKGLSDWLSHFKCRYKQYKVWVNKNGEDPPIIWLSGLHVPESFLTSIVQVTCKKYKWPLDKTVLFSEVLRKGEPEKIKKKPKDGCYVRGLFLEGASWDQDQHILKDQDPKVLVVKLPVIKITPIEISKLKTQNTFRTPVYYTSERANRAGEGLVFEVNLDSNVHDSHWILKGVAVTLNNNNF